MFNGVVLWGFVWSQTHGLRRGLVPFAPAGANKRRNIKERKRGISVDFPRLVRACISTKTQIEELASLFTDDGLA